MRPALALFGRILFSIIFILSGFSHFTEPVISYAASQGVPFANFLVPASGLLAIAGGLSIALGYYAKIGAWLLIAFLVPVTFKMHAFWTIADPMQAQLQQLMFLKNLSMLGGAFAFAYFGSGPYSIRGVPRLDESDAELVIGARGDASVETVAGLRRENPPKPPYEQTYSDR
jgi:putative oxidoreductase